MSDYEKAMYEFERTLLLAVLTGVKGNRARAARSLGIHRNTMARKIAAFELKGAVGELHVKPAKQGRAKKLRPIGARKRERRRVEQMWELSGKLRKHMANVETVGEILAERV